MSRDTPKGKLSTRQLQALDRLLEEIEALPEGQRYEAITNAECDPEVQSIALSQVMGTAATMDTGDVAASEGGAPGPVANQGNLAGRQIGQYKVVRLIGAGGMGQIYEAVQDHPRRTVAIKLMRGSIDSEKARARFHYEVQFLGRLQHPGIARVYDAGTWDDEGRQLPFFAMEYIPNAKELDAYAKEKNLGIDERLALFIEVCEAVAYGHQRGIIHRDLKPGNILVNGQGQVKIIDFGVARATDSDVTLTEARTAVGQIIGTLQYMSPEQCAADPNDIDIRSDVYSLGVVLYELLSGKMPYDLAGTAIHQAIKVVQEKEPTTLSDLARTISDQVEVITHKALEKDRTRRYRSAGDLADDIRRYLSDEPIIARPPSLAEHIRRYARKNKGIAVGAGTIAAVILLSVVAIAYFAVEASRQRDAATREAELARVAEAETAASLVRETEQREFAEGRAERLRELSLALVGDLNAEIRNLPGAIEARQTLLGLSRGQLEALVREDPDDLDALAQMAFLHTAQGELLGGTRTASLGLTDEAMIEYDKAEKIWRDLVVRHEDSDKAGLELVRVIRRKADLLRKSDPEAAMPLYESARATARAVYLRQPDDPVSMRSYGITLGGIGQGFFQMEQYENAFPYLEESRDIFGRLSMSAPEEAKYRQDLAIAHRRIAHIHNERGDFSKAERGHRASLELYEINLRERPEDVRRMHHAAWQSCRLGEFLLGQSRSDEGREMIVIGTARAVRACALEPRDEMQRTAVRTLVPWGCGELMKAERQAAAEQVRSDALLVLQPVVEAHPENESLKEVLGVILAIKVENASP